MFDDLICRAREVWYDLYEPLRLKRERRHDLWSFSQKVSVIIPTHNRADLLIERALPSVLRQTHSNLEVIVAAHGCTDGTLRYLHPVYNQGIVGLDVPRNLHYPDTPRNRWLAGPVEPLNAALEVATGRWIARIDDDDEWKPDHLERLLRFAQAGDYEFVSSNYLADSPESVKGARVVGPEDGIGGTQTWVYRAYLKFMRYNPDCWRKSWHAVNDTDLAERFRNAGVRIGHLDEVTAVIRPRPGETELGLAAYLREPSNREFADGKQPQ